jgi:hypothetical protein
MTDRIEKKTKITDQSFLLYCNHHQCYSLAVVLFVVLDLHVEEEVRQLVTKKENESYFIIQFLPSTNSSSIA